MEKKEKYILKILLWICMLWMVTLVFSNTIKHEKKDIKIVKKSEIKITIWWDVMLSRMVGYVNQKRWFDRITKNYNPITLTGGIVFLNLESPFSQFPKDWENNSYYFGAHTGSVQTLIDLKWNNTMVVSLANNHIRNSLKEWIITTQNILHKNNIHYTGIGKNKKESEKLKIIMQNNKKVCFQAFSYDWWEYKYVYINPVSKKAIKKSLEKMKKEKCDLNMISLHWGREYRFEPTKKQIEIAHYTIDNGADMIIGHHSHIFGKTETYKQKPIFYSLGNYIFDQDAIAQNCWKYNDCIYDAQLKKKILPVQIGVAYEIVFQDRKIVSQVQRKHRMKNFWELIPYTLTQKKWNIDIQKK